MKSLVLVARLLIGGVFIYASIYKIFDPADFAVSIRNYMMIPDEFSNILAMILPWTEIFAGFLLIFGILTRPAALLATGMMVVFLIAMSYAYYLGLNIDCGCFSAAKSASGNVGVFHLIRDAALLLISFLILIWDRGDYGLTAILKTRSNQLMN